MLESADIAGVVFAIVFLALLGVVQVSLNAAACRRLHDTGRPGTWLWIQLVPWINVVGYVVLLVWLVQRGHRDNNRFGPGQSHLPTAPDGSTPAGGLLGAQPMGFKQSIRHCVRNSFRFEGRASRSEFWYYFLAVSIFPLLVILVSVAGLLALAGT